MTKLLSILSILLFYFSAISQPCPTGSITLSSQTEVDDFGINYPSCTSLPGDLYIHLDNTPDPIVNFDGLAAITTVEGQLNIYSMPDPNVKVDLSGLENIQTIEGELSLTGFSQTGTNSLKGLEGLTSIGGDLRLHSMDIENFEGLNNLTQINGAFYLDDSQFENFEGLGSLDTIRVNFDIHFCTFNSFSGWENLKSLESLFIMSSTFMDFTGLDSLSDLQYFFIAESSINSFNGLKSLKSIPEAFDLIHVTGLENFTGLDSLEFVRSFSIWNSEIIDFTGLESLKTIEHNFDVSSCYYLTSMKGLENLESIGDHLQLNLNDALGSITELESLDFLSIPNVYIGNNYSLSMCANTAICNYLAAGGAGIADNSPGCNGAIEIIAQCTDNRAKVNYFNFYDLNQNELFEANEPLFLDARIKVDPLSYFSYQTNNGGQIFLDPGDYELTLEVGDNWTITSSNNSINLIGVDSSTCDSIYFGVYPNVEESLLVTFIQSAPTRCNEFITFEVSTKNLGTTKESGILWLEVDQNTPEVEFIDIPDTIVDPHRYGWFFTDLFPSESITREIRLKIPGPPGFPVGTQLYYSTAIDFVDQPWVQTASAFRYQPEMRCSYDPNDKLVAPNREGQYTLFEEYLIYTIRFQNTGNDVAYDVLILDTLDANLDASTFQLLGTSHEEQLITNLKDGQFLSFEFENIFLPDSTSDLEGSQGYVSYLIRGKNGLAENTAITNTASIYFDANPPVVTNTTQNIMVSELPTTSTKQLSNLAFTITPNPAFDQIQLTYPFTEEATIILWNQLGRVIDQRIIRSNDSIDLSRFKSGIYWLEFRLGESNLIKRFVKIK